MLKSVQKRVSHSIRAEIQALSAYHVPDPSGLVKLDAMENPYTWPASLRAEWSRQLADVALNRYPDPEGSELKARLRREFGIADDLDLMLGNGSDELIQILLLATRQVDRPLLIPVPTFSMYKMIGTFVGVPMVGVPLKTADFALDVPGMKAAIERHHPSVVFLSHPNNPTGNLFAEQELIQIIEAGADLVVVDEAYHAFAGHSFLPYLAKYDNLLILRTLSKMGLAGLRLGVLVGAPAWIAELDKIRLPYNINTLSQRTAEFALDHAQVFAEQGAAIRRQRQWLYDTLRQTSGLQVFPSDANFILFRVGQGQASMIFSELKINGVLIKSMDGSDPLLHDCLRVTVGTPDENQCFMDALRAALKRIPVT